MSLRVAYGLPYPWVRDLIRARFQLVMRHSLLLLRAQTMPWCVVIMALQMSSTLRIGGKPGSIVEPWL